MFSSDKAGLGWGRLMIVVVSLPRINGEESSVNVFAWRPSVPLRKNGHEQRAALILLDPRSPHRVADHEPKAVDSCKARDEHGGMHVRTRSEFKKQVMVHQNNYKEGDLVRQKPQLPKVRYAQPPKRDQQPPAVQPCETSNVCRT